MEDFGIKAKSISKKYVEKVLNLLFEKPGITHREICELLSLTSSGLTNIMNKMKKQQIMK